MTINEGEFFKTLADTQNRNSRYYDSEHIQLSASARPTGFQQFWFNHWDGFLFLMPRQVSSEWLMNIYQLYILKLIWKNMTQHDFWIDLFVHSEPPVWDSNRTGTMKIKKKTNLVHMELEPVMYEAGFLRDWFIRTLYQPTILVSVPSILQKHVVGF